MNTPSDADLLAKWRARPAPLLPLLHDFHERDGFLSEESLRAISEDLRIPIADLFGTVTFYHHFSRDPEGYSRARASAPGRSARWRGPNELLAGLPNAQAMPCPGRCDEPIPVLDRDRVLCGTTVAELSSRPSPLPPAPHPDIEECVFAHIRSPGRATLAGYRATGGYSGLENALRGRPDALLDVIDASGLAGRGGAGFPTGRKWRAVAEAAGEPKTIVCNADEGEPGCFKDRALMDYDPHAVIEGMIAAGFATGATRGFIYLRYEYPDTLQHSGDGPGRSPRRGAAGAGSPGARTTVRPLGTPWRGRLHLRRGDISSQQPRGQAPVSAQPAALPGDARVRGPAHGREQRRNAGFRAPYPRARRRLVQGARDRRPRGHEGDLALRGRHAPRQLRSTHGLSR